MTEKKAAKPKKKKAAKQQDELSASEISIEFRSARIEFLEREFGGEDGLIALVDLEKKRVRKVLAWDREEGVWREDMPWRGVNEAIVDRLYHNDLSNRLRAASGGNLPLEMSLSKDMSTLADNLQTRVGVPEEVFDTFDRRETGRRTGVIGRGLFGELGVYEVHRDKGGKMRLERQAENKPEYRLLVDFEDAGFESFYIGDSNGGERPATIKTLREDPLFAEVMEIFDGTYFAAYKETPEEPSPLFGNHAVDQIFCFMALPFLPVDTIPTLHYIGPAGLGKGTLVKAVARICGKRLFETRLPGPTLTTGTEECKGPRLLEARSLLRGPRIAAVMDAPKNAMLDTGFARNLAPKDEVVEVGGMYKSSVKVDLRVAIWQLSNELLRHNDSSGSIQRRQIILRARNAAFVGDDAPADAKPKDEFELDLFGGPQEAVIRRMLWEAMRYLVEVTKLKMPPLCALMQADREEANRQSNWSLAVDLKKALRKVDRRVKKDDEDWDWRHSNHAEFRMREGQQVSKASVKNGRPVDLPPQGSKAKPPPSYNGIYLLAKVLCAASGETKAGEALKVSTIVGLLDKMGYEHDAGRNEYRGVRHTAWMVERLMSYYGSRRDVEEVLRALYCAGRYRLTAEEEDILDSRIDGKPREEKKEKQQGLDDDYDIAELARGGLK